ncbi:MAG: hypothetical protein PHQ60_13195 [Sideroxydans sp.]|nr:hypothetical protein [Sideroxydans sp.]
MKEKLWVLLLVAGLLPIAAHAGLLGRINSYYSETQTEAVKKANEKLETAKKALGEAEGTGDQGKIQNAQAVVAKAQEDLTAAKLKMLTDADTSGVVTGTGAITVSTVTGGGTPIDFAAYQMNMLLWKANCEEGHKKYLLSLGGAECEGEGTTSYRFIPVYLLLHKTLISQVDKSTLTNDLLNNEHGGLINLKFTPSLYEFSGIDIKNKDDRDPNAMFTSLCFDLGVKGVEAPSVADPKTTNLIGAAYLGVGITSEFTLFNSTVAMQEIASGRNKPDGHLAVGFGVYSNIVDNGNIDATAFTSPVPKAFGTYVLSYEFQVNNVISLVGSRSIPTASNSLGSYTSFAVRYQPAK